MINTQKNLPSVTDIERAERLRKIIEALHEINQIIPVIVEGKKDASALRRLGLIGEIIILHNGKSLYDFCTDIEDRFHKVIILVDWDKKGKDINKTLSENLKGHWEEFSSFRELLKLLCQKEISVIEGIPKLLDRLEGNEPTWQ